MKTSNPHATHKLNTHEHEAVPKYSCRLNNSLLSEAIHDEVINEEEPANVNEDDTNKSCASSFFSFYCKHQLGFVVSGAALGIAIGIGLSYWTPENQDAKDTALLWIGLLGNLFLRALKCTILPLVFVSITISVMDMLALGKAGMMVAHTIGLYILTTVCAVSIGILSSLAFSSKYLAREEGVTEQILPEVRFACSVDSTGAATSFLTEMNDGSVICSSGEASSESNFLMEDVNGYYATSAAAKGLTEISMSESLYQGLFMQLISPNMLGMFTDDNFLGVIIFGAAFGVALSRLATNPPKGVKWTTIVTTQILEELMQVFMMFVHWIIWWTPICVLSLVATAIGSQSDLGHVLQTLGWLFVSFMAGVLTQFFVVYCGLYYFYRRTNPFDYFKHIIEAFTLAFACASSAATLPVTLECVIKSGKVPPGVARFVLPLGATINMDGSAVWTMCACIALAYLNGITPTAANYVVLAFVSTLGTIGAAPVPAAGIVLILTCYETTFGSENGIPYGFAFIIAIDWLVDRFVTMFNVCGDTVVASLVSRGLKDEEDTQDMTERVGSAYKIEDVEMDVESMRKSAMSA